MRCHRCSSNSVSRGTTHAVVHGSGLDVPRCIPPSVPDIRITRSIFCQPTVFVRSPRVSRSYILKERYFLFLSWSSRSSIWCNNGLVLMKAHRKHCNEHVGGTLPQRKNGWKTRNSWRKSYWIIICRWIQGTFSLDKNIDPATYRYMCLH